ncbi:MAG: hypothetical protein HYT36_01860 [Candidatus Staskawiczbacteria bacterium]|nr:hypothetical protein [Candidatus Staskawiczbacteria bacterium]
MDEDTRKEYPDEVVWSKYAPPIKRVKDYRDMTHEDYRRYGVDLIRLAAKDIPLSRATPYH